MASECGKMVYLPQQHSEALAVFGRPPGHDRTTLEVAGMSSVSVRNPRSNFIRSTPHQVQVQCDHCQRQLFRNPFRVNKAKRYFCDMACRKAFAAASLSVRVEEKINRESGEWFNGSQCWRWIGFIDKAGYGRISVGGRAGEVGYAHRVSYEFVHGPIPEGLVLDHLCRNRWCCNPEHLEAVRQRENFLRGVHPYVAIHQSGRCARGHERNAENTYYRKDRPGHWLCRACKNERRRAARHREAVSKAS